MKQPKSVTCACVILLGACSDSGSSSPDTVTLSAESLAGPDGTVVYRGEERTGQFTVPANSMLAVKREGQVFLYHPSLGDEPFDQDTSTRAVGLYIAGLQQPESGRLNQELVLDQAGARGITTVQVEAERSDESTVRLKNLKGRFVAVKATDDAAPTKPEIYFLSPVSTLPDLNFIKLLRQLAVGEIVSATERSIELDSGKLEVFGATARAYPIWRPSDQKFATTLLSAIFAGTASAEILDKLPAGYVEAIEADPELHLRLNVVDLVHLILSLVNELAGQFPFEAVDLVLQGIASVLQATVTTWLTDDAAVGIDAMLGAMESIAESVTISLIEIATAVPTAGGGTTVAEGLATLQDILKLLRWVYEADQSKLHAQRYAAFDTVTVQGDGEPEKRSVHDCVANEWVEAETTGPNYAKCFVGDNPDRPVCGCSHATKLAWMGPAELEQGAYVCSRRNNSWTDGEFEGWVCSQIGGIYKKEVVAENSKNCCPGITGDNTCPRSSGPCDVTFTERYTVIKNDIGCMWLLSDNDYDAAGAPVVDLENACLNFQP